MSEVHGETTTLALSKNSKNATSNNIKKHLETAKSESKYHQKGSLEGIRKQEIVGTPPETRKKQILLTGTPIRVAKEPPKASGKRSEDTSSRSQSASKVLPKGVLEARRLES